MAIPELKNKKVLVTGAASGIGRAAAFAFAKRGAHIIAMDVNPQALKQLQVDIVAVGGICMIHQLDVSNDDDMKAFAEHPYMKLHPIDVLINNAGIGYLGQFLQSDLSHWRRVMDINLMGVVHGCYHFIPQMIQAGGVRHVLNVASAAGIYPSPTMGAYAASKHAVFGFSEVLKMELDDSNVRITTVCPGIINTAITQSAGNISPSITDEQLERLQAYYKAKGCEPELVAEAMVRAVQKGQDLVLIGPFAKLIFHLKRLSLGLMRRVMLSAARKLGYL
ncbi:Short-chain dehydrogenase [Pseudomonas sp. LAMO17WK12:I10]|uniref:SDR family NAD(P)-dependent oxidoreductase n=1 Tax=unclassified Pseudomonas TaxID=196821 RepID=UPI000BC9129C|nr:MULTISPECIES: SDR family NAD(P)-dependent oxidoreductase [unclassified Pseudomonas]PXX54677.1 short-subunit dehydrogenase [Pseudomonas sp. LAMO17WK12:I9]SNY51501.1 Short-chain dehydrogenase [Pseudomonas sp. LAMO17WK12:I10]